MKPPKNMRMVVGLHECCNNLPGTHKVPVLVWVDQDRTSVTVKVRIDDQPHDPAHQTMLNGPYGLFTHLIWIDNVPNGKHNLHVLVHKDGFTDCEQVCQI